ncbi:acyl-CoA dehydrogenase family member 11-like isoform X3 [Paramormyrops kingsleyae]|uniref:acyl-CoA dehydrogenase family member 11-like isoform X3 n=1 Tax=Paramormyrops kingsleyae TaxID=1676925 RepID=UPI000CD5CE79|nr:acyl-CoA dehydrogenase family member 11-like isoform X3 [Paramormyrops kingsleyae]
MAAYVASLPRVGRSLRPSPGRGRLLSGSSTAFSVRGRPRTFEVHREAAEQPIFFRSSIGSFFQERPQISNPFYEDALLQKYLKRNLPFEVKDAIKADLARFGERLVSEVDALGRQCEKNPPHLQQYDAWGHRVDRIFTCPAWNRMKEISAQEGLIAAGYERVHGEWSRVYQMSKIYLYSPSAGLYTCPLAMTDGAAKVIESLGMTEITENAFQRLTSRDPQQFWTSGQWMTERKGGSDVGSGTETIAHKQADGTYKLYGYKWFTSATDANMTLTLARVADPEGHTLQGSRGLSLFFATLRDEKGELKGIEVQRLKDKLGTRQVPTAELLLDGFPAHRVETRAAFLLMMEVCRLLGREENGLASPLELHLLRLLTPVAKLYTGKQAVSVVSEGLECFGGQGYMEDTGLPTMLRDAQVLTIWEGTTNILSLDVLRCMIKSHGQVLEAFFTDVKEKLRTAKGKSALRPAVTAIDGALIRLGSFVQTSTQRLPSYTELAARDLAFSIARIYMGALMVDQAAWEGASQTDIYATLRWCEQDLCCVATKEQNGCYDSESPAADTALVYEGMPGP